MTDEFDGCFHAIVTDPAWSYLAFSDASCGAVSAKYQTHGNNSGDEIRSVPVGRWAADPCILALWTTWPKINLAIHAMEGWGFTYKTGFPWIKTLPARGEIRPGIGFWSQSASEPLLIGTIGSSGRVKSLDPVIGLLTGDARQFYCPIGRHSQKPESIQDRIEQLVDGPYLELYARRRRPGWSCWGYDTGFELSSEGVATRPKPRDDMPLFDGMLDVLDL